MSIGSIQTLLKAVASLLLLLQTSTVVPQDLRTTATATIESVLQEISVQLSQISTATPGTSASSAAPMSATPASAAAGSGGGCNCAAAPSTPAVPADSSQSASVSPAQNQSSYLQKTALVFELDEGWGNGIIQNQDTVALQRMIASMKAFQGKYEVYALLPATQAGSSKLTNILDVLASNGIPFMLEAESSDTIQFNVNTANNPYDAAHGFGASVAQLQALKTKYGSEFAGVRFMEVFGENQQIVGCKQFGASWCYKFTSFMPSDNFFEKSLIEPYVAFAYQNSMVVLFGDHFWSANYNPQNDTYDGAPYFSTTAVVTPSIFNNVIKQPQNEKDIENLAAAYPGTIVALYDNNDGAGGIDDSAAKIDTWESQIIQPFIATGGFKGFGLSDQSWLCPEYYSSSGNSCPVSGVISWAQKALARGALIIETEPYWFWFNMPDGQVAIENYTTEPQWANRGYATANLQAFASALGVTLPSQPIVQAQTTQTLDTYTVTPTVSCLAGPTTSSVVSVNIPYNLPFNSDFSISDSATYANGFYGENITGLSSAQGPGGFTPSATVPNKPAQLSINPGQTYYITIYDGVLNYGSVKSFNIPLCPVAQPTPDQVLDTYTITPTVSCLSAATTSNIISVKMPYAMPTKSNFSVSDSSTYTNGYYTKVVNGLSSTFAPAAYLPSNGATMPATMSIVPGKTYYGTLYDGSLNYGSVKPFSIPLCAS